MSVAPLVAPSTGLMLHYLCLRTPSAIGSAIGRPYLALSRIHAQVGVLDRLVLNRLGPRDSGATMSQTSSKQARNKNAIGAAILNRVLDRD